MLWHCISQTNTRIWTIMFRHEFDSSINTAVHIIELNKLSSASWLWKTTYRLCCRSRLWQLYVNSVLSGRRWRPTPQRHLYNAHASISSRHGYCNSLLHARCHWPFAEETIQAVQRMQLLGSRREQKSLTTLRHLHWLPVRWRIENKLAMTP